MTPCAIILDMKRKFAFRNFENHAWLKKPFSRLNKAELDMALSFIDSNDHLDKGSFEYAINRMFLDNPDKPKHFKEILELLTCANSSL